MVEKYAVNASSRDSEGGGPGPAYYNYEPGHKYALSTVNTEFRNKFSISEANVYKVEANRVLKNKKVQSFRIVHGTIRTKKLKRNNHMGFASAQVPNHNIKTEVFEWTPETEDLLSQILLFVHFDFERAQAEFVNSMNAQECINLEIPDLQQKWTEID